MTIDMAIHDLKGAYASDYNKQLAEWLEELKELRSYKEKWKCNIWTILATHWNH